MSRWGTSSDRPSRTGGRRGVLPRPGPLAWLVCVVLWLAARPAAGQTFLTQDEALRVAFPEPASIERRTAFLSDRDVERARELAGSDVPVDRHVVTYYVGRRDGDTLGFAYFDAHRVRTLPEVLMIVVSPRGVVERIEVLRFAEPREYLAPERWLDQFEGLELSPRLSLKGAIVNLTGATLTSRAVTRAARRVLALHRVIVGVPEAGAGGGDGRRSR